jgi:hypothetical protein
VPNIIFYFQTDASILTNSKKVIFEASQLQINEKSPMKKSIMKFSAVFLLSSGLALSTGHPMMVHPPPLASDLLRKRQLQMGGRPHHGGNHTMDGNSTFGNHSFDGDDHFFHHHDGNFSKDSNRSCDDDGDGPSMDNSSFDGENFDGENSASDAPSNDPGTNVLQMQQVSSSFRLQGMAAAAVASVLYVWM